MISILISIIYKNIWHYLPSSFGKTCL